MNILVFFFGIYILARLIDNISMKMYKYDVKYYWRRVAERYVKENHVKWDGSWSGQMETWLESHNLSYYRRKCKWGGLDQYSFAVENVGLSPEYLAVRIFDETVIKDKSKFLKWGYALEDGRGGYLKKRAFLDSFKDACLVDCIVAVPLILLCYLFIKFIS